MAQLRTTAQLTYPRFVSLPAHLGGGLLLALRTGIAGLGDDHLFYYWKHTWSHRGVYLKGVQNSP